MRAVSSSIAHIPLRGTAVNTAPLSVSSEAGDPCAEAAPWKLPHDVGHLEHALGHRCHEAPGVIIDHVQDLDLSAAGQAPGRDVGLPALVRHLGPEPDEGAAGTLC